MLPLLLVSLAFGSSAPPPADVPNIVFVLSDDQGWGDFGFIGNDDVRTPALDDMAARGAWFDTFYVAPVCGLTRASLMTGRYHLRTGVVENGLPLRESEVTVAELLRDAGYATGLFGKWHLGDHAPHRPQDQGFDEVLTFPSGILGRLEPVPTAVRYTDPMLERNGELFRASGYATDVFFGEALEWIERVAAEERPFFACIPTNAPHKPLDDVPAELYAAYSRDESLDDETARVYAMVSKIDENVARLFARLDELELTENTLVIYTCDNGPNGARWSGGLRDAKGSLHEGGIRVPLLAHWPARITRPGRRAGLVGAHVDLLPTLLEAAGVALDPARAAQLDGRSFLGELVEERESPERTLFFQAHVDGLLERNWAVRSGNWKLLHDDGFGADPEAAPAPAQLYDLGRDPREENDLASERPEVVHELEARYASWLEGLAAGAELEPTSPYPLVVDEPVLLTKSMAHDELRIDPFEVELARGGFYRVRILMTEDQRDARGNVEFLVFPPGDEDTRTRPTILNRPIDLQGGEVEVEVEIKLERGHLEIRPIVPRRKAWQCWVERVRKRPGRD